MTTLEEGLSKEDQEKIQANPQPKRKAPAKAKVLEIDLADLQAEKIMVKAPGGDLYRLANMGRDTYTLQLWKRK